MLTSEQVLHQADFTIPVEIEGNYHNVYVIKRPGVDQFMKRVGELYEVVVFTASVSKVGFPPPLFSFIILEGCLTCVCSMVIRCLISSIFTMSSTTGFSGRVVLTTKATMLRYVNSLFTSGLKVDIDWFSFFQDLSQLGRDLKDTIIIDNSPTSYIFHPQHAVPISSWFSDAHDNELLDLIPVLEDLSTMDVRDVTLVLDVSL